MDTQIIQGLVEKIDKLEQEIKSIKTQRITQAMIIPSSIKQRHMGEPNRYCLSGAAADRPGGESVPEGTTLYFATDTFVLYTYTGSAWKSIQLV